MFSALMGMSALMLIVESIKLLATAPECADVAAPALSLYAPPFPPPPPLTLVGVSLGMERGCQHVNSTATG